MSNSYDYQLLDFGGGRRLERFGRLVLDRPCPAAEGFKQADPDAWRRADARFEGRNEEKGEWTYRRELPKRWTVAYGPLRFELKRTDFGHLGLFPEQAENWNRIAGVGRLAAAGTAACDGTEADVPSAAKRVLTDVPSNAKRTMKVLNLFAYTGGSTLAAAAAGMEVVHVDAAKNVVAWARRNAELSGLADAPVHWIVEDAVKFVERELKRGNRYDAVILDPPSYGHGPRGEVRRLSEHLPRLLRMCGELTSGRPEFMLLTCHTPGYDADKLRRMMLEAVGGDGKIVGRKLTIRSADGRKLPAGVVVRLERTIV
ncbi:MAG: class I SAM-dependent methyltransferase [Planctomycetes bacterium]|nr:class I SAM-dependent methyltransferase [Planctomycetota bacterium]MCG2684527.1 class I SAM-dependent methyltransferase [Planctomycetales bacterium]